MTEDEKKLDLSAFEPPKFEKPKDPNMKPIFLGEGDEQIQIGEARIQPFRNPADEYLQMLAEIPVFGGPEPLRFRKDFTMEDLVRISGYIWPDQKKTPAIPDEKGFIYQNSDTDLHVNEIIVPPGVWIKMPESWMD